MKLSKKIVSMILVAVMLIAQVSVLPLATESYSSGKGDSASYALAVPDGVNFVGFGTAIDGVGSWVESSSSIGRKDDDSAYADDKRGNIFIAEEGEERFFVLNPSAKYAEVTFKNAPANTYTGESPVIYNGIPSVINYKNLKAMAFRIKATGTIADKLVLDIELTNKNGTTVAYAAKKDMLFVDMASGLVNDVAYSQDGIELAGNANGWLLVSFTGFIGKNNAKLSDNMGEFFEVSNSYNPNATGYKGFKVTFKNEEFNSESKKLYLGDTFFVESIDSFRKVHATPAAPAIKGVYETSIELIAEAGVEYSVDGANWNTTGKFTDLVSGKKYTIYSRYEGKTAYSTSFAYTLGVADIELLSANYNTIKVYAVSGMEYCLNKDWDNKNTTGVFTGLEPNTKYTVYVREAGKTEVKSLKVKTTVLPYTTGMNETAYYALKVPDSITELTGAYGTFTGTIASLPVEKKDGVNYVVINPNSSDESTATIGANALTYNKLSYGLPEDIARYKEITGLAFRMSVEGGVDGVVSKFSFEIHNNHKLINGDYEFINIADGSVSTITYDQGFVVDKALDGWIILPFEMIRFSEDVALTGIYNQSMYKDIIVTLYGADKDSDWTGRKLNIGTGLFYEDYITFIRAYSIPHNHKCLERDKTFIYIDAADGVEYAFVGTDEWTADGRFENLTPDTTYEFKARYIGRTDFSTFTFKTRLPNPTLTTPKLEDLTVGTTSIVIDAPYEDHEYSVDGINWIESGVFENLISGASYNLVARLYGTTKETVPLVVKTSNEVYATGLSDGASYIFRVPTAADVALDAENNPYIDMTHNANSAIKWQNETEGAKYAIKEIDGYNFIEIKGTEANGQIYQLQSSMVYNGAPLISGGGLPEDIKNNGVKGIAVRFAITGNEADEYSMFDFLIKSASKTIWTRSRGQMMFIDAKTGKVTDLEYRGGIKFYGEVNGWVVIPAESFSDTFEQDIIEKYEGYFRVNLKKEFADNNFYLGEVLALADIDKFLQVRSAPRTPTLLEKDTDSISVVATNGLEYCMDGDWTKKNTTGVFEGLKQGKEYKIYAKYVAGEGISDPFVVNADLKDPSMDQPKQLSLTYSQIVIDIVPGITYSVDNGASWRELANFDDLEPNTKYTLVGMNKATKAMTPSLTFTTPKADNPYYRGDGSSDYMPVSKYEGEYYQNKYGYSKQVSQNGISGLEGGRIKFVEIDGEKFIEFRVQEGYPVVNPNTGLIDQGTHANLVVGQTKEFNDDNYVDYGFPDAIWLKDGWGFAMRIRVEDTPDSKEISALYYEYYDPIDKKELQKGFSGTYYLIDNTKKTYTKKTLTGNFEWQGGFDGWIVIPFKTLLDKGLTYETIQKYWAGFRFFNYDGRTDSARGTSDWSKTGFYVGDAVVVEDANLFMEKHAPNTEEKIVSDAHNTVTTKIPGVMANDCSGDELYAGLTEIKGVNVQSVQIEKPYEKSEALALNISGYSSISITNDALNYKEIPEGLEWQVMDSLGMAFYINVPKSVTGTVGFDVQVQESNTEYHTFNGLYYYTVSDGVASKNYGKIELNPGFNGAVILPFELFNYDSVLSEYVDGLINSPETIGYFKLEFATPDYPALSSGTLYVDDFYLYQNLEEYITFMLKTQGNDVYEIVDNVFDPRKDEEPSFPRDMANNCSSIAKGESIYSTDNVSLSLVAATQDNDAHINVTIGDGDSSVMFSNYAYWEDMSFDEYNNLIGSTGITFWLSVPEDAPMTVGLDLELMESECEYFWYDPNCWYYTVEDGTVTQYYGYLEFKPGFEGTVVIPLECFYFDEFASTFVDGHLYVELINYFGFYFDTAYYASIGGTTISVDDIAFCQGNYRFIDAVWAKQTGNSTTEVDPMYWSVGAEKVFDVVEVVESPVVAKAAQPMQSIGSMSTVLGLAILATVAIVHRRKAEDK